MSIKINNINEEKYLWRMLKQKILKYLREYENEYYINSYVIFTYSIPFFTILNFSGEYNGVNVTITINKEAYFLFFYKHLKVNIDIKGEVFAEKKNYLEKVFTDISNEYNIPVYINYEVY